MFYISTTRAYPATTTYYQQVLSEEHRYDDDQINAVHPADINHDSTNISSLQLSFKHEHDRKERQVLGCQMGTEMKPCGSTIKSAVKHSYSLFMQILNKNEQLHCVTKLF